MNVYHVSPEGSAKLSRGLAGDERIRILTVPGKAIPAAHVKRLAIQSPEELNGTADESPGVCGTRENSGCASRAHERILP